MDELRFYLSLFDVWIFGLCKFAIPSSVPCCLCAFRSAVCQLADLLPADHEDEVKAALFWFTVFGEKQILLGLGRSPSTGRPPVEADGLFYGGSVCMIFTIGEWFQIFYSTCILIFILNSKKHDEYMVIAYCLQRRYPAVGHASLGLPPLLGSFHYIHIYWSSVMFRQGVTPYT